MSIFPININHHFGLKTHKVNNFLENTEVLRLQISNLIENSTKSENGQYFSSLDISKFMASLLPEMNRPVINILDPGAGVGILSAAVIGHILAQKNLPKSIIITAYEIDKNLISHCESTFKLCQRECKKFNVSLIFKLINKDFIVDGCTLLSGIIGGNLFQEKRQDPRTYDIVITNPPYKKILSGSIHRKMLSEIGIETSNLYSAFIAISIELLSENGYLVGITPRSFCNGLYFKPFRNLLYKKSSFKRIHLFHSRKKAFSEDDVLQENVIYLIKKENSHAGNVIISTNESPTDESSSEFEIAHNIIINDNDPNKNINIIEDDLSKQAVTVFQKLPCTLQELGLNVSTGQVVDFRATQYISRDIKVDSVPLIYPKNFFEGHIFWPLENFKKCQAIVNSEATKDLILKNGFYVLTKRFTSKEEFRRVVAVVNHPMDTQKNKIAFENHLNYFHQNGKPLDKHIAIGLSVFLNSTLVDMYFRMFSGHTQVNATDLQSIRYPDRKQLERIGIAVEDKVLIFPEIDKIINKELFRSMEEINPVISKNRISEAINILKQLGIPKSQQNERSGLTLLALLNLKPADSWEKASNPKMGITEMMTYFEEHYGKRYAPNSRETVRRFTVHQFIQAGIVIPNPDAPKAVNSPNFVYQIENEAMVLIREYGTSKWDALLVDYLSSRKTLIETYAQRRTIQRITINDITLPEITLSYGDHNILIKDIIKDFRSHFLPTSDIIYIGDTENKEAYIKKDKFTELNIELPDHGKMPDVVLHDVDKNWLLLVEAVTSHGPINPGRKIQLEHLFKNSKAGLVFITAFPDRKIMMGYLKEIAWETEIWIASEPDHMVHLNGERFLGPYKK